MSEIRSKRLQRTGLGTIGTDRPYDRLARREQGGNQVTKGDGPSQGQRDRLELAQKHLRGERDDYRRGKGIFS